MAQHIPVELFKQKAIKKIANAIRKQRYFKSSLRYEEVVKNVFITWRRVPESIVVGGQAGFQVHLDNSGKVEAIYLVA